MKTIAKMVTVLVTIVLAQAVANAQAEKSDPTYSTSNYKQPNKAAYMKKLEEKQPVVYVEEVKEENGTDVENSLSASSNYKTAAIKNHKIKKFKMTSTAPSYRSGGTHASIPSNYKMPYSTTRKSKIEKVKDQQTQPIVVAQ